MKVSIEKINSDFGNIEFHYGSTLSGGGRLDIPTGIGNEFAALDELKLIDLKENTVRTLRFEYDYIGYAGSTNSWPFASTWSYLTLKKLKDFGSNPNSTTPLTWEFDYFGPITYPVVSGGTQYFARKYLLDNWGFYNADLSFTLPASCDYSCLPYSDFATSLIRPENGYLDGGLRAPNLDRTKEAVLKSVKHPLGALEEYEYELNDYLGTGNVNTVWGGLRIKKVKFHPDGMPSTTSSEREYRYRNRYNLPESSGRVGPLRRSYDNVDYATKSGSSISRYSLRYSDSNRQSSFDGIRYGRVEVVEPGKGMIIYEYTTIEDYPDLAPNRKKIDYINSSTWTSYTEDEDNDPGALGTDKSWLRGLLKKKSVLAEVPPGITCSAEDLLISEDTYDYTLIVPGNNITGLKVNFNPKLFEEQSQMFSTNQCWKDQFQILPTYVQLKKVTNKEYSKLPTGLFDHGNEFKREVVYDYNSLHPSLVQREQIEGSDGVQHITQQKYPFEYADDPQISSASSEVLAIRRLNEDGIISTPIEVRKSYIPQGGQEKFISGAITHLKDYGNSLWGGRLILPSALYTFRTGVPQPSMFVSEIVWNSSSSQLEFAQATQYVRDHEIHEYNNRGQLLDWSRPFDVPNHVFWGGRGGLWKVAETKGASVSNLATLPGTDFVEIGNEMGYCGFESDQEFNGRYPDEDYWHIRPGKNNSPTRAGLHYSDAHTGNVCQKVIAAGVHNPYEDEEVEIDPTLDNGRSVQPFSFSAVRIFKPERQQQKYRFSAYTKTPWGFDDGDAWLVMEVRHADGTEIIDPATNSKVGYIYAEILESVNDWRYNEVNVDLELFRQNNASFLHPGDQYLLIQCYLVNYCGNLSHQVLVDDLLFRPVEATFTGYTYEPNGVLSSVLDNNTRPVFNIRDDFGRVVAKLDQDKHVRNTTQYNYQLPFISATPHAIVSRSYLREFTLDDIQQGMAGPSDYCETIDFIDGSGRSIQTIKREWEPSSISPRDLFSFIYYDANGNSPRTYLPFVSNYNGQFLPIPTAISQQGGFYQTEPRVAHDVRPWEDKVFTSDPFNTLEVVAPPGDAWSLSSNHVLRSSQQFNAPNKVKKWKVNRSVSGQLSGASYSGYYGANELKLQISKNEDGEATYVYTDKLGRVVCKELQVKLTTNNTTLDFTNGTNSETGFQLKWRQEYIVYDEFGQMVYQVSCDALERMSGTGFVDDIDETDPIFKGYIHATHYDSRGRPYESHIPGAGWTYACFDRLDRPTLTQNAKQRINNEWFYKKYDRLGRIAVTGKVTLSEDRELLQELLNQQTSVGLNRSKQSSFGYDFQTAYPQDPGEIRTAIYYDDYDFEFNQQLKDEFQQNVSYPVSKFTIGQPTASLELVLGTVDYLKNVSVYDDYARLIESHSQNYTNFPATWDVLKSSFDFVDNLGESELVQHAFSSSLSIRTSFEYDKWGRLLETRKQVGAHDEVIVNRLQYNALGQLARKQLHVNATATPLQLQGVDYRFSIRGWLKSINNARLESDGGITNEDDDDRFGEELLYNEKLLNTGSQLKEEARFSGKISRMLWRTKPLEGFVSFKSRPVHSYVYRYDDFGRLTAAYYSKNDDTDPWSFVYDLGAYNEKEEYDLSGNIITLQRHAEGSLVDDLYYSYYTHSNQLESVTDASSVNIDLDFHDNTGSSSADYQYDAQGSVIQDNNKGSSIDYNDLGLPDRIYTNAGTIQYQYTASGRRIAEYIGGQARCFVNGAEYNNQTLVYLPMEEGRIRPVFDEFGAPTDYVFDYYLRDHIGNVRVVITSEQREDNYFATMEMGNSQAEEALFYNIPSTREDKLAGYPVDNTYSPNDKASELSLAGGKPIGHAKVLRVSAGDTVSLATKYFFSDLTPDPANVRPIQDILNQLANLFILNPTTGSSVAGTEQSAMVEWATNTFTANPELTNFLTSQLGEYDSLKPAAPQAFIVWMCLDKSFKFLPMASGVLRAKDANTLGTLAQLDILIPENGFLYVYVTNESNKTVDFDNLAINHRPGSVLEENHYYPYGMLIESLSHSTTDPLNTFKYNGIHFEREGELNSYIAPFRTLDPTIARWNAVDPMNQFLNPYVSMGGDPVAFSDPWGLWIDANPKNFTYNDNPDYSNQSWMDLSGELDFQRGRKSYFGNLALLRAKRAPWGSDSPESSLDPIYKARRIVGYQLNPDIWYNTPLYYDLLLTRTKDKATYNQREKAWGIWKEENGPSRGTSTYIEDRFCDGETRPVVNLPSAEIGLKWEAIDIEGIWHFVGPSLILLGQPIDRLKPKGFLGSAPGSSIASRTLSKKIPATFTQTMGKKVGTKVATRLGTNVIGRAIGRLVPGFGWGISAFDAWNNRVEIGQFIDGIRDTNESNSYKIDGTWNMEWHVR